MRIGLMGFEFGASNKGCEALSYSFMPVLRQCWKDEDIEILNFWRGDALGRLPQMYPQIRFLGIDIKLKDIRRWKKLLKDIRSCDLILDITHGDSFSDIYGRRWFVHTTLMKQVALWLKVPLILMPQTYGPFKSKLLEKWAMKVISGSLRVYCRDEMSHHYLEQHLPRKVSDKVQTYTDLAFALPWNKEEKVNDGYVRIGINISGLLWHNCETGNQLGLAADYHEYCRKLLRRLLANEQYRITLIPHVICDPREGLDYYENDCRAIRELIQEFPQCIFADQADTAIDVKSIIAAQDVFVGARMHATIGAISSGVACIPFAYSRKFQGLYQVLNYPYIVDGKTMQTDEAVEKTLEYIRDRNLLKQAVDIGMLLVREKLDQFTADFRKNVAERG